MKSHYFNQGLLFSPEEILKVRFKKYDLLFSLLDTSPLESSNNLGRPSVFRPSILRALIYKNIRCIHTLTDLVVELSENPAIAHKCGFNPLKQIPSVERFSSFLRHTPNRMLQQIREGLVQQLVELGEISGKYLSADSCPIKANVKENNLKTSVKDRFNKHKIPAGDAECRLGVIVTFPTPWKKKVEFFWGYRNHIINDATSELPIIEMTKPANVHGTALILHQLQHLKDAFVLTPEAVIGDSEFDSARVIEFIVKELMAKPIIAKNPRGGNSLALEVSSSGAPMCIAGFEMLSRGIFKDKKKNRVRHKFICPIRGSKRFAKEHPICPWWHPNFLKGSGCYKYLRVDVDDSIRRAINYDSPQFKKLYNLRTSSERIFSRFLSILMQHPTVKGLNATANLCTIAHITVLTVALTAVKIDRRDKIRFVKSLLPNI